MASASSMPSLRQKQDLKRLLECSICLETFDNPRTLPCLHSFCEICLDNFVKGKHDDELKCPECRYKFTLNEEGVAGIKRNHFICNMVEVLSIQHQDKTIPCLYCQQPSTGRCVTCELFMCEECFKPHNDFPGFQDHLILTMEELSKPENQSKIKNISKCTQHPKKKLKYYCDTCNQLICRHCMDFDHDKQHTFLPLEQAAQNKRKDLKENCEMLERSAAASESETCVLKEKVRSLENNFDDKQRLINQRKLQLLTKVNNIVEGKANSMIEDAREVFDGKTKIIAEEIRGKEGLFKRMRASANMARSLLENGSDEEIVRSYQSVQENVNNAVKRGNQKETHAQNQAVQSWRSDEIDAMLIAEITGEFGEKNNRDTTWSKDTKPLVEFRIGRWDPAIVAYVYDTDYKEIQTLVHHYPNIQTGGDLFGLWQDEQTVIIQQFIGPGKNSKRTTTSFHQDIEYLQKVGSLITTEEGLCNVGEWHSHHQRGIPEPTDGDRRTVFSNMPHLGLERFVLFIATIEGKRYPGKKKQHDVKADDVQLRPFLFVGSSSSQDVVPGEIRIIPDSNPHRRNNRIMKEIEAGAEAIPGGAKKVSASSDENYDWTNKDSEKKKTTGGKGSKPAQDKAGTKDKPKTLQQEAKEFVPQEGEPQPPSGETQPQTTAETAVDKRTRQLPPFSRATKPREGNETEPYKYDESLGRRPRDNLQRASEEQKQYEKTEREKKETEEQRRRNNENCSPNAGHAAQGRGNRGQPSSPPFQTNAPHQSGTTTQSWGSSRNMPPTTSPSTFRKTYEESRQPPGYTQPMSRGSTRGSHKAPAKEGTIPAGKMCAEGYF